MAAQWKFFNRRVEDDSCFLHEDYQPTTPSSKINLEERFGLCNVPTTSMVHQYENWGTVRSKKNGGDLGCMEKIYENQQEMLDATMQCEPCAAPPPLPPRNTPARRNSHFSTTINIDASTNIAPQSVNTTIRGCAPPVDPDDYNNWHEHAMLMDAQEEAEEEEEHVGSRGPSKYQSKSSSALQQFSVLQPFSSFASKRCNLNQTFAGGDGVYSNISEVSPHQKSFKQLHSGIAPLWHRLHPGENKENKHNTSKFFKRGGHRLTQAMQGCRTAIANISQKFRASTQRRYKLDSSSPRGSSYATPPRGSIRRTPGKLYSPFNCNTPPPPRGYETKRLQHRPIRSGLDSRLVRTPQSRALRSPGRQQRGNLSVSFSGDHQPDIGAWGTSVAKPHSKNTQQNPNVLSRLGGPPQHRAAPSLMHHQLLLEEVEMERDPPEYPGRPVHRHQFSSFYTPRRVDPAASHVVHPAADAHHRASRSVDLLQEDPRYQRHLVEFDQLSRNITVSLNRGSKFRNSVR
ncbi:hypothetical protein FHG87_003572 [Trinorchestia longiramus]|nr:hypothetical protein FHG87_003572 [Trinorchestia longiramus]